MVVQILKPKKVHPYHRMSKSWANFHFWVNYPFKSIKDDIYNCHESGYHSPKLHITHGLHLPACTALTHSRPPLHQSHSCHHSLINPDCLTTPAPHSLTHIKAAHKHSLTAKSCFALATFLSVLPCICYLSVCDPGLPDLRSLNLCLWPRPLPGIVYVSALPLIFLFLPVDHCLSDSAPA